uniref:Basic tail secreted protein n=1 Tax=Rhipicephalus zambeziensis TaxID=60191 RepID=A0A224Y1N6_9ACAR
MCHLQRLNLQGLLVFAFYRMESVGVISFIVMVTTAGNMCDAGRPNNYPSCNDILSVPPVVSSCLYFCRDHRGWRQQKYPNETPCKLSSLNNKTGRCWNGICQRRWYPSPTACDHTYNGKGYATTCTRNCSENGISRTVPYKNGTPCLTLSERGKPYGGAGMCRKGVCVNGDDLGLQDEPMVHPPHLLGCKVKENYSKMVLQSCYYYCQMGNKWYYGYYNSTLSSSCNLYDPNMPNLLGWCCKGVCMKKPHCGMHSIP